MVVMLHTFWAVMHKVSWQGKNASKLLTQVEPHSNATRHADLPSHSPRALPLLHTRTSPRTPHPPLSLPVVTMRHDLFCSILLCYASRSQSQSYAPPSHSQSYASRSQSQSNWKSALRRNAPRDVQSDNCRTYVGAPLAPALVCMLQ